jgi:RNA polymerase sigma-32 factor
MTTWMPSERNVARYLREIHKFPMMRAVKRFDPDRSCRLATYAMWWVRAAIQEYILRSGSLVKMGTTAAQKKLFFNLRRLKGRIQVIDDGDLSPENVAKIATELDVPEGEVVNMNRRLASPDHSLNAPMRADADGEWQDWLTDDADNQEVQFADREEQVRRRKLLMDAMHVLNERERHILGERRLRDNPATLDDLSQHYNLSRERIRQIEACAFGKLRQAIRTAAREQRRDLARMRHERMPADFRLGGPDYTREAEASGAP